MSSIHIVKSSITSLNTDCIVNAANEMLWQGSGVCGAIFKMAGAADLKKACDEIGGCKTGSAVITPGFNLKARYIIHAVGPRWRGGSENEKFLLESCYLKSLDLLKQYNCHSIGFPLISAGVYGYPIRDAWVVALQSLQRFIAENCGYGVDVFFAIIDDNILKIGQEILMQLLVTGSDRLE